MSSRTLKVLHIVNDQKFIDHAYAVFEQVAPGCNQVLALTNKSRLEYINSTPALKCSSLKLALYRIFPFLMPRPDLIVVHGLTKNTIRFLRYLPWRCKVVWIGMGFDYYDLIGVDLLKAQTRELHQRIGAMPDAQAKLPLLLQRLVFGELNKSDAVARVDYFAPVLPDEFELVRNSVSRFSADFISWNYTMAFSNLERNFKQVRTHGTSLLIGNSGSYPNNHLEIFQILQREHIENRKIVVPLSYGDSEYIAYITAIGRSYFGENFVPLTEFMTIERYISTLSECNQVIMNHSRQQAVGNIIIMLYIGARVYLDRKNIVYQFFKGEGAAIYTLEDFTNQPETRLCEKQVEENRRILAKHFSDSVILQKTRCLLATADI